MMAATREDPVVMSDSSDVLSDTENGEWLVARARTTIITIITNNYYMAFKRSYFEKRVQIVDTVCSI